MLQLYYVATYERPEQEPNDGPAEVARFVADASLFQSAQDFAQGEDSGVFVLAAGLEYVVIVRPGSTEPKKSSALPIQDAAIGEAVRTIEPLAVSFCHRGLREEGPAYDQLVFLAQKEGEPTHVLHQVIRHDGEGRVAVSEPQRHDLASDMQRTVAETLESWLASQGAGPAQ